MLLSSCGSRFFKARVLSVPVMIFVIVGLFLAFGIRIGVVPQLPAGFLGISAPGDRPSLPKDLSATPLLAAPVVPETTNPYAFMNTQENGLPVTYDPCREVHYVVRMQGAPEGGLQLIQEAVGEVSSLTGLKFVFDGSTEEAPSSDRSSYQPELYGDRWAPVLVTWAYSGELPSLDHITVGEGGSTLISTESPNTARYITGSIALNSPEIANLLASPNTKAQAKAIILHELGHLVGLGHVDAPSELMYPETGLERLDFGLGDRKGLSLLGRGPCFRDF